MKFQGNSFQIMDLNLEAKARTVSLTNGVRNGGLNISTLEHINQQQLEK